MRQIVAVGDDGEVPARGVLIVDFRLNFMSAVVTGLLGYGIGCLSVSFFTVIK